MTSFSFRGLLLRGFLVLVAFNAIILQAQTCQSSTEMEEAKRTALMSAGQRYFDMVVGGDAAGLHQNAIPSLAADFAGIESSVKARQPDLAGSKGTPRPAFLLDAGTVALPHAEFYCGVFGKNGQTAGSAVFYLNDLPAGKYGIVIFDATAAKTPTTVSFVLPESGSGWKLGGLYIKSAQLGGHEADWFVSRARDYKSKAQPHNAWLYYQQALSLIAPLPFMSTAATDKLYDESHGSQPLDFPLDGKTVDLPAGAVTYKLTALFVDAVGNDLDLIVKYQTSDVSNTTQAYQNNVAVMKALVAKYPEVKDAFAATVARAVEPSGRDYGTLLAMKEIK